MSVIQIHNVEQGSEEWLKLRLGVPTASEFQAIVGRSRDGKKYLEARKTYLYTLAGQRITGKIEQTYGGGALARGHEMEDEARRYYELMTDEKCQRVGFITNSLWKAGCSPDSLIGKKGGLELKTKSPHLHIACLETITKDKPEGEIPDEHLAQVQGGMGMTNREWWDFESYWPGMPPFILRVERDEKYIATLKVEVLQFNDELDALVRKYTK